MYSKDLIIFYTKGTVMAKNKMKKPKETKKQRKKVKIVMDEFKRGELPIGKSKEKVVNPKQAIAIALSEAKISKKKRRKKK